MLALQLNVAVALGWLLVSYVAIGLVESILGAARKLSKRSERDADRISKI